MLNLKNMSGLDMVQELNVLQLPNLQLLNLDSSIRPNNSCEQWQIQSENMPLLKELYCAGNFLRSIYHFSKLDQLKLLDVAHN